MGRVFAIRNRCLDILAWALYVSLTPVLLITRSIAAILTAGKIKKYRRKEEAVLNSSRTSLRKFEKRVYSQNGEDGIIEEIFHRIGTKDRFFVEFGIDYGQENNTRLLLETQGWKGVWLEGCAQNAERARDFFKSLPVNIRNEFITKDNILNIFSDAKIPKAFDLLSIDIDGNDYWIFKSLLEGEFRPRVVAIEFNAKMTPPKRWVMPYDEHYISRQDDLYGASLESLNDLALEFGYSLVGCNSAGVNAFFVNSREAAGKFDGLKENASYHYACPKYSPYYFGHPPSTLIKFELFMRRIHKRLGKKLSPHIRIPSVEKS